MRRALYKCVKILYDVYNTWINNTKNSTLRQIQITHCTEFLYKQIWTMHADEIIT